MDSHILRKAAYRLPALADVAVLRFNTRGTMSAGGTSEGEFGDAETERADVAAAIAYCDDLGLPRSWLLGWSFGTELALKWGLDPDVEGAILRSLPLQVRDRDAELDAWPARLASRCLRLCPSTMITFSLRRHGSGSAGCRRPR